LEVTVLPQSKVGLSN